MNKPQRHVEIRTLPDGRARIHWFIFDSDGPVQLPHGDVKTDKGPPVHAGGSLPDEDGNIVSRGRIACEPARTSVLPETRRGKIRPVLHSDDPRGATCPECQATPEWQAAMARLRETVPAGG